MGGDLGKEVRWRNELRIRNDQLEKKKEELSMNIDQFGIISDGSL